MQQAGLFTPLVCRHCPQAPTPVLTYPVCRWHRCSFVGAPALLEKGKIKARTCISLPLQKMVYLEPHIHFCLLFLPHAKQCLIYLRTLLAVQPSLISDVKIQSGSFTLIAYSHKKYGSLPVLALIVFPASNESCHPTLKLHRSGCYYPWGKLLWAPL